MTVHPLASMSTDVADAVRRAVSAALPDAGEVDPLVRPSNRADFQANVAMSLAKRLKQAPAAIAAQIAERLDDESVIAATEVSGPGFINISIAGEQLWTRTVARLGDDRLGVGVPREGERTVIDYSAPNIAKEMHVGHLRTTVIGDCLSRVLSHLGADVVAQNHLGDWGTQFGMLIQYLDEHPDQPWRATEIGGGPDAGVSALDELYRASRGMFDSDPEFAERARARVVALQAGDEATLAAWREIIAESEKSFQAIYHRMDILLTPEDSAGESMYNAWLEDVVTELTEKGIAVESRGALCVFNPDVLGPDGEPTPLIIRKSDGGYGYATTDLATIRYRMRDLKADRVLYVVDARQSMHFKMIFDCARRAGWITPDADVRHLPFGTVLGPDGKPFKTRSGGTVRLTSLLDDAVARASEIIAERHPDWSAEQIDGLKEIVGMASVKYAELSTSRIKDYVFDVERMVSFTGDTGAYLQYAHARVNSILRKAAEDGVVEAGSAARVDVAGELAPQERALVLALDAFGDCLTDVAQTLEPHRLCGYLYELAKTYTDFYENRPVLKASTQQQRDNRLALCRLTAATLERGLNLLGIAAPERL